MGQLKSKDMVDIDVKGLREPVHRIRCNTCLTITTTQDIELSYQHEKYLCSECFDGNENIIVGGEDVFNEREKCFSALRNETDRLEKFDTEIFSLVDRTDVKCPEDCNDCRITGMCIYENKWLILCDEANYCIKILQLGTNELIRYISFTKQPWDVTTIKLENKNQMYNTGRNKSMTCVTFPNSHSIWWIDINGKHAIKSYDKHFDKKFYSIVSSGNKIYAAGIDDLFTQCSIYVLLTDGEFLKQIYIDVLSFSGKGSIDMNVPHIAVSGERIYITDHWDGVVYCLNEEANSLTRISLEHLKPRSIAVARNKHIYIHAVNPNKIYKDSWDLRSFDELPVDENALKDARSIMFNKDILFVSHELESPLRNFVTIIRHL